LCTGWNWQLERVSASEDGWVERGKGKGKEIEIGLAGPVLKWQRDMEVRYPASSSASEEVFVTGRGGGGFHSPDPAPGH